MFGHQDQDDNPQHGDQPAEPAPADNAAPPGVPTITEDTPPFSPDNSAPPQNPALNDDAVSPAGGFPKPLSPSASAYHGSTDDDNDADLPDDVATHDLIDIKQQALTELSPLIDKLDQTPEERFRTLMMMIQASDNQQMVKDAFQAAHGISDEKIRAQALLDIINEVNYFTQPHDQ